MKELNALDECEEKPFKNEPFIHNNQSSLKKKKTIIIIIVSVIVLTNTITLLYICIYNKKSQKR